MSTTRAARTLRFLSVAAIAVFAVFCVLLLVIRLVVFPRIDEYRERIVATLSAELGQPVAIVGIDPGWDGWNPKLTIRGLQIHDREHLAGEPLVDLPRVDFVVSWTSVPFLDLRLKELSIARPQLAVRRDQNGRLHLAGIEIDPERQDDDTRFTAWLLRQPSIVVTDALVTWTDELRRAPQLVLDHVNFRLEHSFGHHRFGLVGTPPASLASPLDFRGDVTDVSFKDWREARGRFYVRLDYADIGLWREWIPFPVEFDTAKGAVRAWFDMAGGRPTGMVTDFELADVRARLGKDLPQLDLTQVAGHLDWKNTADSRTLTATGLTFTTPGGQAHPPTNFELALTEGADGTITSGRLAIDRLEAEPLTALATHLPLPEGWRRDLLRFAPRGSVSNGKLQWSGTSDVPDTFAASGSLQRFGFATMERIPGATGVSGTFNLDETHGLLRLDSRDLKLDAPRLWSEPVIFTTVAGGVTWDKRNGPWRVTLDELRFASAPLTGVANGTWTAATSGPGALDLRTLLAGGNAQEVTRYLPLALHSEVREWLQASLKHGTASDVRINVTGDLADFPFADNRNGKFLVALKVKDATLRFLPEWPPLEGLDADLKFEGARMTIDAARGRTLGGQLGPTKAEIANLAAANPVLTVTGDATGPTSEFLQYIVQSPIAGWIGHTTDGAQATGTGKLQLKLSLPLGKDGQGKVAGEYQFNGNELRFPGVPALTKLNGRIAFTEQEMHAQDLVFEALGGPAKAAISHVDGRVRVTGGGTANTALLRNELDEPLLARLSGTTDWQLTLTSQAKALTWTLESSLKGAAIDLPAPIGKVAAEVAPLKVERREVAGRPNENLVVADYRGILRVVAHRGTTATGAMPDRLLLLLGSAAARSDTPTRPGLMVRGQLPALDLDEWLALYAKEKPHGATAARGGHDVEMNGVELDVAKLDVFGRVLHDFKVTAERAGEGWQLTMHGREVDGNANWRGASTEFPNGRVVARLTRFVPPGPGELRPVRNEQESSDNKTNPWPELDIVSDAFVSKGRDLGKFELVAQPAGPDWRIQKMTLSNADGRIDAAGLWRVSGQRQQTQLDVTVKVEDAGGYLAHFGYGGTVRNAPTQITGQLTWNGAPNDFDYPTLTGNFKLQSGAGQFTKIDPGMGKLLGVLSLQSLPRRITLDFRDVFSEGFAFDDITGDFHIANGQMHTEDLKLAGPAAAVAIKGDIDLAKETQSLVVRVQPSLSSSVSAGAMVLFIANPLIGAAVGAGALLAQKMLNNPIDQIFSYDYRVTGPWADPVVERVSGRVAATATPAVPGSEPVPK